MYFIVNLNLGYYKSADVTVITALKKHCPNRNFRNVLLCPLKRGLTYDINPFYFFIHVI